MRQWEQLVPAVPQEVLFSGTLKKLWKGRSVLHHWAADELHVVLAFSLGAKSHTAAYFPEPTASPRVSKDQLDQDQP